MRVLVTGGAGFIGAHIVSALLARGVTVSTLSRQPRRSEPGVDTLVAPGAADLPAALGDHLFDLVVHTAAPGVRPEDRTWPALLEGCCGYTLSLVDAAAASGAKRIIYLGSWSEYAAPHDGAPLGEDHPLESRHLYGSAKAAGYLMGLAAAATRKVEFVSARLFNIYGPGENPSRLLPYVISRLAAGEAVDLTPGEQERDFVYVTDAAEAIADLALHPGPLEYPVYNICSGRKTSVRSMVEAVAGPMGADPELLKFGSRDYRSDEPQVIVGDPSRIANATGWRARTQVSDGAQALINHVLTSKDQELGQ